MKNIIQKTLFILMVTLVASGCHSFKHTAEVKDNKYPISLTPYLYSETLSELGTENYAVVESFKITKRVWSIGVGRFPLTPSHFDLTDDLNKIVEQHGGNAIVNLNMNSSTTMLTNVSGGVAFTIFSVGLLGTVLNASDSEWDQAGITSMVMVSAVLMPGWNKVTITGEVVKIDGF